MELVTTESATARGSRARYWAGVLVCVLLLIIPGIPAGLINMIRPSRRLIARVSVWWAKAIVAVSGAQVTVEGLVRNPGDEPRVYISNHQSALDIAILIVALDGQVLFLTKEALFRMPLFGWILRRYGHVRVERGSPRAALQAIERSLADLDREPRSLVVFPEGTRSPGGKLLPFRRGTMKMCQRAGFAVVPVCIDGSGNVNPKDKDLAYSGPVSVTFGRPIPRDEVAAMTADELHDRVRSAIAEALSPVSESAAAA